MATKSPKERLEAAKKAAREKKNSYAKGSERRHLAAVKANETRKRWKAEAEAKKARAKKARKPSAKRAA